MNRNTRFCIALNSVPLWISVCMGILAHADQTLIDDAEVLATEADFQLLSHPQLGSIQRKAQTIEIHCHTAADNPWDLQLLSNNLEQSIEKDQVLAIEMIASAVGSTSQERGTLRVHFQEADTHRSISDSSGASIIAPGETPGRHFALIRSDRSYQPGQINVSIHAASKVQQVTIDRLRVLFLGDIPDGRLPVIPLHYAKSVWDEELLRRARERIEKTRKSDFLIKVVDGNGQPLSQANVKVEQVRHAYAFGSFTDSQPLMIDDQPNTSRYRKAMRRMFNRVTLPRYFAEWGTDTAHGKQQADEMMAWAAAEGFELKTHLLLYPGYLPKRVLALKEDPSAFRDALESAMKDALDRTASTEMIAWDAINELRDSDVIGRVLGQSYYAEVFRRGKRAQPRALWFINEYGILEAGTNQERNAALYEEKIRQIQSDGGPIDGIGLQAHFQDQVTSLSQIEAMLDRFAEFGLPIEITEFDIDTRDELTQGEYTRDFLTVVFSHPSTTGITVWGFWEGRMWRPNGAMIRSDWRLKPNGQAWMDLIYRDWWTIEQGMADSDGFFASRPFHGHHRVRVEHQGKKLETEIEVKADNPMITLVLK